MKGNLYVWNKINIYMRIEEYLNIPSGINGRNYSCMISPRNFQ